MTKTQAELEAGVKVYQLDAVESKVDTMLGQLEVIVRRTDGLVTAAQLEAVKLDFKEKIEETVKDLETAQKNVIKEIHGEYRPTLKRINWLYTTVIAEAIALLGAAATVIFLMRG